MMSHIDGDVAVPMLTAKVHVLKIGPERVTKTMAKQLDRVLLENIEPFGRINLGLTEDLDEDHPALPVNLVIGRCHKTGALVTARWFSLFHLHLYFCESHGINKPHEYDEVTEAMNTAARKLRLIVL